MAMRRNELAGQHHELAMDIDRMHVLVAAPDHALPPPRMRALLEREIRDLAGELDLHFSYEEDGGYLEGVLEQRPGLARPVSHLQREHGAILKRLETLAEEVQSAPLPRIKAALSEVLDMLGEHERSEIRMLQTAANEDLGTGD